MQRPLQTTGGTGNVTRQTFDAPPPHKFKVKILLEFSSRWLGEPKPEEPVEGSPCQTCCRAGTGRGESSASAAAAAAS